MSYASESDEYMDDDFRSDMEKQAHGMYSNIGDAMGRFYRKKIVHLMHDENSGRHMI